MLGSLTVTCYRFGGDTSPLISRFSKCFRGEDFPRTNPALGGKAAYNASGNYLMNGTSFPLPAFWTVNALVPVAIANRMWAIWTIRENRLNSRLPMSVNGYRIEVDDWIQLTYEERSLATKRRSEIIGSASSAFEADGGCYFYGRYMVDIDTPPVLGKISDGFQSIVFTLNDTNIVI